MSILKNTQRPIHFYVVSDDISEASKTKLTELQIPQRSSIKFIPFPENCVDRLPTTGWHKSIYTKVLAPQILPELEKVIWLDVDTLVIGDIAQLWDNNITAYALAGIGEETLSPIHPIRHKKRLKMSPNSYYSNAGVLLLNLAYWRKYGLSEKIVSFIEHWEEENLIFFEQDAINVVLQGQILQLDCRFNFFPFAENTAMAIQRFGQPIVVHFIVNQKPWLYKKIPFLWYSVKGYSFVDLWWQYAKLSSWTLDNSWKPYIRYYLRLATRPFCRDIENTFRQYIRLPLKNLIRKLFKCFRRDKV